MPKNFPGLAQLKVLVLALMLGMIPINLLAGEASMIPGTRVRLTPPNGFMAAERFSGYFQEDSDASIMVTEIPGPFSEMASGLTNVAELAKRGLLLMATEEVMASGQSALLVKVQQTAYDGRFLKWILVLGNEQESVLITATFAREQEKLLGTRLRESLLSVKWEPEQLASLSEAINFSLKEQGDLKIAGRFSNALLYTRGGVVPSPSPDAPLFVAAPSLSQKIADPEIFAKNRLLATENLTDVKLELSQVIALDGLKGYEILAEATDRASGKPLMVYQVILFDEDFYYYVLQGQVGTASRANYLPIFKAITYSFKRIVRK